MNKDTTIGGLKYFSSFSGVGAFELAIKNIIPNSKCIGYSEIDEKCINTYESHFNHKNYGDIKEIDWGKVEDFDLLVGGPPCQAYSTQGKRKGIEDPRGTLILDYLNVVKIKNPRYVILENVKGLVNFRKGEVYNFIKGTFDTLGYDVFTKVMNTRNYGLPQNRSRVIFVAIRKDLGSGSIFEFPKESILETTLFDFLDEEIDNETLYFSNERIQSMYSGTYQSENPQNINKYCYTLTHSGTPKRFFTGLNLNDYDVIHEKYKKRKLSQDELNDLKGRMLSPREYEKLQGFPIDWTLGPKTSRYNQIGNSISVPILEAIFRQFLNILH